jgi:hypothetical protein
MKNVVFWDVAPCGSCKNRCFGDWVSVQTLTASAAKTIGKLKCVEEDTARNHEVPIAG